jgi:hypothetical protein
MERINPEPWLRGTINDVNPVIAQVLYSLQHAWEDLDYFTAGLTNEQMWSRPANLAPVGFQIRHIGGSIERLLTYARGHQLSEEQMRSLKTEEIPGPGRDELLANLRSQFDAAEEEIKRCDPSSLSDPRSVGRKALPTTVGGLLVHVAEHTQRHVGQAIVTAKLVKA